MRVSYLTYSYDEKGNFIGFVECDPPPEPEETVESLTAEIIRISDSMQYGEKRAQLSMSLVAERLNALEERRRKLKAKLTTNN